MSGEMQGTALLVSGTCGRGHRPQCHPSPAASTTNPCLRFAVIAHALGALGRWLRLEAHRFQGRVLLREDMGTRIAGVVGQLRRADESGPESATSTVDSALRQRLSEDGVFAHLRALLAECELRPLAQLPWTRPFLASPHVRHPDGADEPIDESVSLSWPRCLPGVWTWLPARSHRPSGAARLSEHAPSCWYNIDRIPCPPPPPPRADPPGPSQEDVHRGRRRTRTHCPSIEVLPKNHRTR